MRTFEQYIEESIDFRLGGSKNKGAVDKTFGELKKGDVFYRYSIDISYRQFTKKPCRCIFECIDGNKMRYFFDDRISDIARFTMFVDKDKCMASYTYGFSAGRGLYYVYSTIEYDKATIIEKIVKLSKKAGKDGNVYESVDFRLGGKNNVDSGNFAFSHLRLGDDVYCVNVDTRNCKVIEREQGVFERSKEMYERMFVYFLVNKRTRSCPVLKDEYETSSIHIEHSPIYDNEAKIYSTYYVEDDEAIELAKEWKDGLKESVDFRLGGSKDKGDLHKSFEELEKGDKIYLCKFENFNIKSYRSDIFEFREKEAHINHTHFMHGRWESGGQPVISILDKNLEKDYFVEFIRGGSVFTRVFSTFEMTAEEALRIANEAWKMKYIREAVDFRLGGKANKGEVPKTFEELEKGDIVYMVETHKESLVFRKKEKFYRINLDPADCYIVFKEGGRSSVFPFDLDYINDAVCVINNVIYSTYEMSDAEARKLAKSERKRK